MSGSYIQVYSGGKFFIENPTVDQIHAADISHALAMKVRYNGHCEKFYSVAEHCCLMADYEFNESRNIDTSLWALLHDATETYIPDFPRPWKRLPQFEFVREAEERIMVVIAERFALEGRVIPDHVDALDRRILCDEARQVFKTGPTDDWGERWAPGLGVEIQFWGPAKAEMHFFERLSGLLQLRIERDRRREEG